MKPEFALSLSAEGIVLLHRAAGGWRNVGSVPLDSADLTADLAKLKAKGNALHPDGACKLIIPNEQIRYLTIETGISDLESRHRLARAALEGATPYPVSDLAFDLSEDGSQTHIAAVAYETLAEAESFALENGFVPASFVACPDETGFLGEPFFGPAPSLGAAEVIPDGIAVVDIGPAEIPTPKSDKGQASKVEVEVKKTDTDPPAKADLADAEAANDKPKIPPAPEPDQTTNKVSKSDLPETVAEAAPTDDSAPVAGFSSRRRRSTEPPAQDRAAQSGEAKPKTLVGATAQPSAGAPPSPIKPAPSAAASSPAAPAASATAVPPAPSVAPVSSPAAGQASAVLTAALKTTDASTDAAKQAPPAAPAKQAPTGPRAEPKNAAVPPAPAAMPGSAPASAAPAKAHPKAPELSGSAAKAANSLNADTGTKAKTGKGKPRFLALILTAGLLLAMAAIAAFALLSEGGLFFASERPPLEQAEDAPLSPSTADSPQNAPPQPVEPAASTGPGTPAATGSAPVPISEVETEPDSIAPQVSALPGQPDPGVIELTPQAAPLETAGLDFDSTDPAQSESDSQFDASTGQPVLDALDGTDLELDPADALSEAALYAATGIWQQVPEIAEAPALVPLDDIYIASIDNSDLSQDAVALPRAPQLASDAVPDALSSPAAAGSDFDLDPRGLVTATPEGTLNPDGVMVYLGRPAVTPPATPARTQAAEATTEAENARLANLSRKRPRARPSDLVERAERALLGGLSRAELARVRPRPRPASLKTEEQESQPVSNLAIATSTTPRARPSNFANLVDRATRQRNNTPTATAAAPVAPQAVTPSIPSSASVARQATVTNALNLRRINLIGVSGKPSNRQALVLLPSGRTRQVRVGDRLDGGSVVAISESQLQYQKRGKNTTLKLPND